MYEKHFSFTCKPFELLPNPEFLYQSSTHKKAITYLDYGIQEKIGFILLTGEIGSGKTTIIRNLIKNLSSAIKLSRINNTKVSSEQLISMINEDFGLVVVGKSKTALLSELNDFLIEQYARKRQAILLIDEAQNLSLELLEEIRLLSNLETDRAKLLQIILVGQPELNRSLMLPEMMQLRQRINISYHINPLTIDETVKYIRHRLAVAGNQKAIRFQGEMAELIYKFSRGIPRLINILCDLALLSSFVEGRSEVTAETVRDVIRDLESRDGWNAAVEQGVPDPGPTQGHGRGEQLAGDMALRIIRLEESMKKCLRDIAALSRQVSILADQVSDVLDKSSAADVSALSERLSRLEHQASGGKKHPGGAAVDREPSLDAAEELRKKLARVSAKLKGS
ncbi:MAG: AAA family ATPase [Nitrospiraceae bacterium]|nr:MAG: AAA family ATPase [Nitrospiraceae bacterium]